MIPVEEARKLILNSSPDSGTELVGLEDAVGRVLAQEISADRDFPPFNRVTMDGIAIEYGAYAGGQRQYEIESIAPAGSEQRVLASGMNCIEVMTGAMLPIGCDTVIRYEDVVIESGIATISDVTIQEGQNIHRQGEDRLSGHQIVSRGSKIGFGEIGIAATVGMAKLEVFALPRICVISTGDEIVSVDSTPLSHQIRSSNTHVISSILRRFGVVADMLHILDDQATTEQRLGQILADYDVLVLSGGVSKGKYDYVPGALDHHGVQKIFHRVQQRPGKPFWFGASDTCHVFALPGNPVSATMCCTSYLLPWLRKFFQHDTGMRYAMLGAEVQFRPALTLFQQASVYSAESGVLTAKPIRGHGSGDLTSLVGADGFIEMPEGRDLYPAGEVFRWWPFD